MSNFGQAVAQKQKELLSSGKDVNQIAKILYNEDPEGFNYGIGIILDGNGNPEETSPVTLDFLKNEIDKSTAGSYYNSAANMDDLKKAVLNWQSIPETYSDFFSLALPSDAGTGAVSTALDYALLHSKEPSKLGVEELGWPAYKAMAEMKRVSIKEFPHDEVIKGKSRIPLYQAGPLNTTGVVPEKELNEKRAAYAAKKGQIVVLDRAYSGFEYARLIKTKSYEDIMRMSFETQLLPYIEKGCRFAVAVSPTKAFVTFALRPAGFLLVFDPDKKQKTKELSRLIRARGSAFEHPATRAFVNAMINDLTALKKEHTKALKRLDEAAEKWKKYSAGTPLENSFSDHYAGLFRNPLIKKNGITEIYSHHVYPVFSNGRCRINITGIPDDEVKASDHVNIFSKYMKAES